MSGLTIDFAPRSARRTWNRTRPAALLMLIVAFALCAVSAVRLQRLLQQRDLQQASLRQMQDALARRRPAMRRTDAPSKIGQDEARAVNVAITQLNLRWSAIFDAIEAATPASVALLQLEPDAAHDSIKGIAEAKDSDDMIAYIDRLRRQPMLRGAVLTRHEIDTQDANRPLRFQFDAMLAPEAP